MAWSETDFQTLATSIAALRAAEPDRATWEALSAHERERIVTLCTGSLFALSELKTRTVALG
jgi:hypothetical protein